MPTSLGLDIGSNSVGSAWVDTTSRIIHLGASVFPAGVEESDVKRGSPKGKARREKRSQRRSIERRAERKHQLRSLLTDAGLLPADPDELQQLMGRNPWHLRREALHRPLTPHEFGRVLVHLNQRRGALGVETDPEEKEEGLVKKAIDDLREEMQKCKAVTFGQFMADLYDERQHALAAKDGKHFRDPIRNRRDAFEFHADRALIREEFSILWGKQKSFGGKLAGLLTDSLRCQLDAPAEDTVWRHGGTIFGQRRTYWRTGTLGRCDLEPTDRGCPTADMHAQEFRVLETVNNIRIEKRGEDPRRLNDDELAKVLGVLRTQKTGSVATIRKALGIHKKAVKAFYALNIEADPKRKLNTDWFHCEIIREVFTPESWENMTEQQRESVNHAILKLDPDKPEHVERLCAGSKEWWGLGDEAADKLTAAWKARPKLENRLSLSRRAIRNLLPYMREGLTVTEARQRFAEDPESGATPEQRALYAFNVTDRLTELLGKLVGEQKAKELLGRRGLRKADRHFLAKHPGLLPPAPTLANPVVRKALHEVRRHVMAYLRKFGAPPDRVVIELAREAKHTEKVRNQILSANRKREAERRQVIEQFQLAALPLNQQATAVQRVILCRQQRNVCAYSQLETDEGRTISETMAADGTGLEIDHIVPVSRSQDNSLNNKVLCFRETNRGKGSLTPKEWLAPEQYERLERRFEHWKKEYPRKWENLRRDALEIDDFVASQLTDTAYAAKQVGEYLRNALYRGESRGKRHVFFTKGSYTAILRRDWGLQDEHGPKPRVDHRHHAIDAVVIALSGPERIKGLALIAAERERAKSEHGLWPKWTPLPPPWGSKNEFRAKVLQSVEALVVSHRPVKRKIVGAFHQETMHGPVWTRQGWSETQFTCRCKADALKPGYLRMPEQWDALRARLDAPAISAGNERAIRRQLAGLPDPRPKPNSYLVHDRELRHQIRECLIRNEVNPDAFSSRDIKKLIEGGEFSMKSGVPIKRVVLRRTITEPIVVLRKRWDAQANRYVRDTDPRTTRVYIGGNNHHIEIREDLKMGRWSGEVIDMFTAAKRIRMEKRDAVDRSDGEGKRFIMSLAEGETIHMRHPETGEDGYFVVFKLDKSGNSARIHVKHHTDARPAKVKDEDGKRVPKAEREDVGLAPGALKSLGPEPGKPPCKVRVGPLGDVTPIPHD